MTLIPIIYGAAVACTLYLALISHSSVLQKVGLALLFAWSASNVVVSLQGFERAPLMIPTIDGFAAILIAMVGYRHRSNVALVVFGIYAIVSIVHVGAFVLRMQATYTYYLTLNLLFLSQLLLLGGSGAWLAVRHRVPRGHQRLRPHPPRRPHIA